MFKRHCTYVTLVFKRHWTYVTLVFKRHWTYVTLVFKRHWTYVTLVFKRHWTYVTLVVGQCCRRWPNTKVILVQCILFAQFILYSVFMQWFTMSLEPIGSTHGRRCNVWEQGIPVTLPLGKSSKYSSPWTCYCRHPSEDNASIHNRLYRVGSCCYYKSWLTVDTSLAPGIIRIRGSVHKSPLTGIQCSDSGSVWQHQV